MSGFLQEAAMHLLTNWNDCLAGAVIIISLDTYDVPMRIEAEPMTTPRGEDGAACA